MGKRSIDPEKLTNWYNVQAPFYHLWRDNYRDAMLREVASILGPESTELRLLDAGCGTGLATIGIAIARRRWRIEGVDSAAGMLRVARRQAEKRGLERVSFRQGDVTALPYPEEAFDAVVAAGLFPNLNDWPAAARELFRVLRPGGSLVIVEIDRSLISSGTKLLFRAMILGYRAVSALFRRFRFAEEWDVRASTVNRERLIADFVAAGFEQRALTQSGNHLILHLGKGEPLTG